MKRSAKVCWVGFVFSTIVLAAVTGLVVYFTAFKRGIAGTGSATFPIGGTTSSDGGTGDDDSFTDGTDSPVSGPSDGSPVPPGTGSSVSLVDHLSHSVPGFEYTEIDYDGDGSAFVQLDGSLSHTHYYDEGPPIVIGKIVEMTWFNNETRKEIGIGAKPLISFPTGTTVVGLTVADNYRDSHTDYAIVTVEKPITDGAYCYYYHSSSDGFSISDELGEEPKPTFAAAAAAVAFEDDSSFPAEVQGTEFQARCVFIVNGDGSTRTFEVEHFGPVRLLVGGELVLESESEDLATTEGEIDLNDGEHVVHLLYSRVNSAAAKLELKEGGDGMQYDMSAVLPVLTKIDPETSTLDGGGSAKITGVGLLNGVAIQFGDEELEVDVETATHTQVFVTVPAVDSETVVDVVAKNKAGSSNARHFQYASNGKPPIKFSESRVKMDGRTLDLPWLTGIKYGPDHRYYASAINNAVHSFAANSEMEVSDLCKSPSLGKYRAILGLAFNPADTEVKLYVSASVLDWKQEEKLTAPDAWANGEILLIQKDVDGACLNKVGDPVITGLPVSNHDHGVNGLVFDDDGNLHIQVGGFTNAGHDDANSRLGGIDENPLSGASLVAPVSKAGFNGKITYSSTTPGSAMQTGGDVSVFSPGWRNSFGIEFHSNGFLYATDNGASVGFGDKSVTCTEHEALPSKNLADKLTKVIQGKYGGHPNRNRGREDPRQCTFRELSEPSDSFYQAPIATFESSTDGVIEYTASTFGGQLKGNLLCSKFSTQESAGKLFRVQLDGSGDLADGPDEFWASSGLSIHMSPWGHILMPRVYKEEIILLTPSYQKGTMPILIAVMPFRGSSSGGNTVLVTGENFGSDPVALFDGKECTDVSEVASDGRSFKCKVPAGTPGTGIGVSLRFGNGEEVASTGGVDYRYMNI